MNISMSCTEQLNALQERRSLLAENLKVEVDKLEDALIQQVKELSGNLRAEFQRGCRCELNIIESVGVTVSCMSRVEAKVRRVLRTISK